MSLADLLLLDDWLRERAGMFPFFGELLCCVAWLIGLGCAVLRHVFGQTSVLPVSGDEIWRGGAGSCDSSWLANATRWLAIGPPQDWPWARRMGWQLSASPVAVTHRSRRSQRT